MRVLLAFDKFKDAMSAREACAHARAAIEASGPGWTVDEAPLADGGEGFCEILTLAANGALRQLTVRGPRGEPQAARWGMVEAEQVPSPARDMLEMRAQGRVAIIEMAQASGLETLQPQERNPLDTTTYGTGQLIAAAADAGAQMVLLGVGGSATNDIGLGALEALGLEFTGEEGALVRDLTPRRWPEVARLAGEPFPHIPEIRIAVDVTNPLLGPNGATTVYGPQKGLEQADFHSLERSVGVMAKRLCAHFGKERTAMMEPGVGAAGGIAFGLRVGCDAELIPGFDLVTAWLDLDRRIRQADMVLTGEGRFDDSSLSGKGPFAVVQRAHRAGKVAHILAGSIPESASKSLRSRFPGVGLWPITPEGYALERALAEAPELLRKTVESVLGK